MAKNKIPILAALAFAGSLVLSAPAANAQLDGSGWREYHPSADTQQRGCGKVSGDTFELTCSTASGDQRAERRYRNDYSSGERQFQGTFQLQNPPGHRLSLKQTFRSDAFFMLAVESNGRLFAVHGGAGLGSSPIGARTRVNTVHYVGRHHWTYINGTRVHQMGSTSGSYYDKYGLYRTDSGRGPGKVVWSGVRFWQR